MFKSEKVAKMRGESLSEIGQITRIENLMEARNELDQREKKQKQQKH